jgi:hypothetical protein
VHGLALLLRSPPLWPVPFAQWRIAVERVEASAYAHDCEARAAGWSDLQLYGLHPHAPWARLDAMGAGFPIARRGDRVITVAPEAIVVAAPLPRAEPHPESVVAWSLQVAAGAGFQTT